jgi:hypothetical protein
VDLQDFSAAGAVGRLDRHTPVEAAGTQQCRVEHVGAVGGRQNDHRLARVETIHLDQQLVERLLTLVVPADKVAAPAPPADRVQLVDEDDRRCALLGLGEQVAHTGCADADHDLDELRAAHTEERHVGLARHRAGQQCLARPRCADQQHALGDASAEPLVFIGLLEEIDDLDQFGLDLVDAGHVVEGDPHLIGSCLVAAGAALAQAEHAATGSTGRA